MKKTAIWFSLLAMVALGAACSSETTSSSPGAGGSPDVCADVEAVQSSFDDLKNVDTTATGTDGLQGALDELKSSLEGLKSSASTELSAQVAALETAVTSLESALSSLGDGGSLTDVGAELAAVATAAQALVADLGQCS